MFKRFIKKVGLMNAIMLAFVVSIIIVAEYIFITGDTLHAIFIGLWAPSILGFMNYLKPNR